jgi:hypothetical protein
VIPLSHLLAGTNRHLTVLVTTLKKIVNEAWGLDSLDSIKLARYMRCLFQVALSDSPDTAEQLLGQICSLAQEAAEVGSRYPHIPLLISITDSNTDRTAIPNRRNRMGCDSSLQPRSRSILQRRR